MTAVLFLIILVVLVVAHELGHFLAARLCGVSVQEFGIGYPPRLKKLFKWNETLFTLNLLPFGGFVKIFGEDGSNAADHERSFAHQKFWKRAFILLAGVAANMLLAIALYAASFSIGFLGSPQDFPNAVSSGPSAVIVTEVIAGSPAQRAGFIPGDSIVSMASSGESISPSTPEDVIEFVQKHSLSQILISYDQKGVSKNAAVLPEQDAVSSRSSIGLGLMKATELHLPPGHAVVLASTYVFKQFGSIVAGIGALIAGAFGGGHTALFSQISGPVGIAGIARDAYGFGWGTFLSFVALISINLAVINLLPLPALDGGRLILEIFSKGGRSRIPKRVESGINRLGFLALIILMLFVTYRDIAKIFA